MANYDFDIGILGGGGSGPDRGRRVSPAWCQNTPG